MSREKWSSRSTFILAAIGSAVGLGNAWRFPGLAYEYGGGAFLLVYVIAMLVLGLPLLMMEIVIGKKMQRGAPGAFRGMNKKTEFVGWSAVANAFVIVCYYAILLAWVIYMIAKGFSFGSMTGDPTAASKVFMTDVIKSVGFYDNGAYDIPGGILIAVLISWGMIYWCIRKGTTSVGKVVKYTVFIPVVLLLILAINGFTLPNAMEGMKAYLIPEWAEIANPKLWVAAFGQVFYSMSIMMAIMIAYGSFLPKDSNVVKDTLIIGLSDILVSFLAGVVLFTTLAGTGNMGQITSQGITTAFIVYPMALVKISEIAWINSLFAVIFYVTLLTLAIDSAFSIVEGISTAISDKFLLDKRKTTLAICCIAGVISLLFATRCGIKWLDIVDHWANEISLIFIGVLETVTVGWFFKTSKIREELNRNTKKIKLGAWYDWMIKFICPLALSVIFVWNLVDYFTTKGGYENYPMWTQILGGWVVVGLVLISGFVIKAISKKNKAVMIAEENEPSWDEM